MKKTKLEELVDDYLDKHERAVAANQRREAALRYVKSDAEKKAALDELIVAHNARAAAFRALRQARKEKP